MRIGGIPLGEGAPLVLISGLNVIESAEDTLEAARTLRALAERHALPLVFKASYDKANRSSLESYRGPGIDEGVRILDRVKRDFRAHDVALVYGTIRLIEEDDESFLAWARQPYACIIFNLHAVHTPEGLAKVAADFRRLIGRAIEFGGSYYLTYHRWATRRQVETCHPQLVRFLQLKRRYDPAERFQSEWYRHYRTMFAEAL